MKAHATSALGIRRKLSKVQSRRNDSLVKFNSKAPREIHFGYQGNAAKNVKFVHFLTEWARLKEKAVKFLKTISPFERANIE
jgi:hypothetical protein